MAWTAPKTYTVGEVLTAATLNTHLRDNLLALTQYVTSLPASPGDGEFAVLVDSLTAPTYQWRFRYNAGSSAADKWECLGGVPATVSGATLTVASTTATDYTGGSITVPRQGVYDCRFGANATNAGSGAKYLDLIAAGTTVKTQTMGNRPDSFGSGEARTASIAAASAIKIAGRGGDATSSTFDSGYLFVMPVRVS